jgi:hypothetical protein
MTSTGSLPAATIPSASAEPTVEADTAGYVNALAVAIDHFGLVAFSSALTDLAERAHDVAPVAARVLADPDQPLAARERAFARVALALTSTRSGRWPGLQEETA